MRAPNLMRYLVSSDAAATKGEGVPAVPCPVVPGGWPTMRRMRATPLPVSMALAGQTIFLVSTKVHTSSMRAQARMAERICGTDTAKPSDVWPRTWMVMITPARWRRGSRMLGSTTG